jgi:hypothetical protein
MYSRTEMILPSLTGEHADAVVLVATAVTGARAAGPLERAADGFGTVGRAELAQKVPGAAASRRRCARGTWLRSWPPQAGLRVA